MSFSGFGWGYTILFLLVVYNRVITADTCKYTKYLYMTVNKMSC